MQSVKRHLYYSSEGPVRPEHAASFGAYLSAHDVKRAIDLGWDELRNGDLIRAAEDAGFEVLLSGDKKMRFEQNMKGRRVAVVCLSANNWPLVRNYIAPIREAVGQAVPGTLVIVECGTFLAHRFRKRRT